MRFMIVIKANQDGEAGKPLDQEMLTAMGHFNEELVEAGVMLDGVGLHSSARGTRVRLSGDACTVVDGPFAETKELIAGYWLWEVKSKEEAIAWARRCPTSPGRETVLEIRQVYELEDFGPELTPELREQEERVLSKAHARKSGRA